MSSLYLDRQEVEKAVKEYYNSFEPELFKRFNFDEPSLIVNGARQGYGHFEYVLTERGES